MKNEDKILIIGAGLCGSLLALRLAQRSYKVEVYESRPDLRKLIFLQEEASIWLCQIVDLKHCVCAE